MPNWFCHGKSRRGSSTEPKMVSMYFNLFLSPYKFRHLDELEGRQHNEVLRPFMDVAGSEYPMIALDIGHCDGVGVREERKLVQEKRNMNFSPNVCPLMLYVDLDLNCIWLQ
ncbi:hypothetical protein HNY73_014015 [Argiope bruennichi]|uniref:Uncharacterized protein n=1 Tax=Argiope bruennichi TaxID=94029 RepID=A0A8T0EMH5_ARGBR|nr:hypothetical protein HNY73_014015 [Argiope bruennichi]